MQDFPNKKILLGICGGISAYKSALLVRALTQLGAIVRVVMTDSARQFVTPWTLQALGAEEVRTELFDADAERAMGHIELARWADYLLIAPASANNLAKMAHGLADDLLSALFLVTEAPVIVCPAMNRSMWANPATQSNCALLAKRGVIFCGPEEGSQACGEFGLGRMSEVDQILDALRLHDVHQLLVGKQILVTAGPTREAIDPIRYLSNRSSGKMGYALARAAQMAGAEVTLISGPVALPSPTGIRCHHVSSAEEMMTATMACLKPGMIFISAAAVADYRVHCPATEKIKKRNKPALTLDLTLNPDILTWVSESQRASYVIGFSAETTNLIAHAKEKLRKKKLDMVIANLVGEGQGFEQETNRVTILTQHKETTLPLNHKTRLAGQIIAILAENLQNDTASTQ